MKRSSGGCRRANAPGQDRVQPACVPWLQGREEGLTHPFLQRMPALIETWKDRMADERVRVLVGVTARGPIGVA